jgi:hypothetical protein
MPTRTRHNGMLAAMSQLVSVPASFVHRGWG